MISSGGAGHRRWLALLAVALMLAASAAEARPGRGGMGFGSRGTRTFEAPPSTATAPRPAAPIERSVTPARPETGPGLQQPAGPRAWGGGFFGRGLAGGLLGGLLGAGLFGMLFGSGLFGGLGGVASIFGLMLQVALIGFLAMLAWRFFQRRAQPAAAGMSPRMTPEPITIGNGARASNSARGFGSRDDVGIVQADYDAFERLLGDIQTAYGREDIAALRRATTPEMAAYFEEELAQNTRRGVINRVSEPRLLQGDLAEAWAEGGTEYATVAMRFSVNDHAVDRASGRVLEGDPGRPTEATEVWTFRRDRGGDWRLSALQPG